MEDKILIEEILETSFIDGNLMSAIEKEVLNWIFFKGDILSSNTEFSGSVKKFERFFLNQKLLKRDPYNKDNLNQIFVEHSVIPYILARKVKFLGLDKKVQYLKIIKILSFSYNCLKNNVDYTKEYTLKDDTQKINFTIKGADEISLYFELIQDLLEKKSNEYFKEELINRIFEVSLKDVFPKFNSVTIMEMNSIIGFAAQNLDTTGDFYLKLVHRLISLSHNNRDTFNQYLIQLERDGFSDSKNYLQEFINQEDFFQELNKEESK